MKDKTKEQLIKEIEKLNKRIAELEASETERKKAEEAIKESRKKFQQLYEEAPVGYQELDCKGTIVQVNKTEADMLGYSIQEMIGKSIFDFIVPEEQKAAKKRFRQRMKDQQSIKGFERKYIRKSGEAIYFSIMDRLVTDNEGKIIGMRSTLQDITERKRMEEEIRKLNAELEDRVVQLEATNKELEAFTYSVSHDLRAPLRHTSGYVELFTKRCQSDLSEKGRHYLNSIADSARQMGLLIDDLLQFSRTGRMEMHQSDIDMNRIVQEVFEQLRQDNSQRNIEWIIAHLPSVYGDYAMLRLVWMNLLSNAVKFTRTREKAKIEVQARDEIKEVVFFVRDNGVGFDMKYAQKLFGVFQRLHSTEEYEGTGIGLANVRRIILRHGGRTWAEAELDKGATIYFSIPK